MTAGVTDNLPTLLVVEDEKNTRDGLRRYFDGKFDIYLAPDVTTAMNVLESQPVDVLLTDLRLTGGTEGLDLLVRAQSISHPPVCVLMTAYGSEKVAVQAMKQGAYDYVTKPLDLEKLDVVLTRALHSRKVETENQRLHEELDRKFGLEKLIGNAPAMVEIYDRIRQVAPTRATVLIEGESGTGKELVAQSLHMLSPRKSARFVAVHCAALSPQLLESELFGHEKGAFTGAIERRMGRFEEANHGTIFLDEIGEIDAATQVKLLRALGEQTIQRVGSNQTLKVDVRVVAATNKNLETLVREGKFREDLFYRLDVVPIRLPPLRERREDIPLLVSAFLQEYSRQNHKKISGLSADAQETLQRYDWPGNVRELRAAIEHAVALCRGERVGLRDLPARVLGQPNMTLGSTQNGVPSAPTNLNLENLEKNIIQQALRLTDRNVTEAAKLLGISRRTLHRKIKAYQNPISMNITQAILHELEVGKARIITRIIPLSVTVLIVALLYNFVVYHGLNDAQSMDNAQVARQIVTGSGFTTKFIRPFAVAQLNEHAAKTTGKLFPDNQFPTGAPRILPDTYNAPGYPYLLAAWFKLIRPEFDQPWMDITKHHIYSGDRWIPELNQIFLVLTAILVFGLGRMLFDDRVAWIAVLAFLGSDMVWQYSITALSTSVLMFLITALLFASVKIFCIAEDHFENDGPFWPVWIWTLVLGLVLAAACLTRLHLLVLLVPVLIFLAVLPRTNFLLLPLVAIVALGLVGPWFWHLYKVSGNPVGSNLPQLLYGEGNYTGNQIFCQTSIPLYEQVFKNISKKELLGFRWHFEHAWELLGSNLMVLLFAACTLHRFKRRRASALHWFIIGSALCIIAANNFGTSSPDPIGPWNNLVLLFPAMVVIGSAYFFILLDRLDLQLWLLNNAAIIVVLGLIAAPLALTVTSTANARFYNYPPYYPFYIKNLAQMSHEDEWVTTDMPWATAWYGDRASLWLPDSLQDFENLNDTYCSTGMLILTSVTTDAPMSNLISGEYQDWFLIFTGIKIPPTFPLPARTAYPPGGNYYYIWSDLPRWTVPSHP